jgi:formiminotetrahydrofolate cyclodeaminase
MGESGAEDRRAELDAFLRVLDPEDNAVGGGTASSVAGAMAAALVAMVARLSMGKQGLEPDSFYEPIIEDAQLLARELMEGGRADARAFDGIMVAYRLPKTNEEEQRFRREAIQRAMVVAALTPLANAQRCRRVLDLQRSLQGRSNANAVSDLTCAAHLSVAGIRGCLDNVRVNLRFIEDGVEARAISTEVDDLNRFVNENG